MSKVPPLTPEAATIVVGFSARALAEATAAANSPPLVVDHFADHDCRQAAEHVVRINPWGGNVLNGSEFITELLAVGARPQSQVLLAGGTENWPELVELLHQHFTVLGPTVGQLRQLRSPECWQQWAKQSSVPFPEILWQHDHPAGNWLRKPLRSAGGYWIRRSSKPHEPGNSRSQSRQTSDSTHFTQSLATSATAPYPDSLDAYWQQHVPGRSLGVYCVLHHSGSEELLGATESISAAQWPGPSEFIYRGSLGPIKLPPHHCRQVADLCHLIQRETGLLGWLQLDFIEDQAGDLWLLELNPRWAAGMEVLFLAGINPVVYHCRAWQAETALADTIPGGVRLAHIAPTNTIAASGAQHEFLFGKAIVYAPREIELTHQRIESLHSLPCDNFADLPSHHLIADGQTAHILSRGEPLLTVRTGGPRSTLLEQLFELRETALAALA